MLVYFNFSQENMMGASSMSSRLALSIAIGVWILASVLPVGAQGAREEPKIALLIGNSAYREAPPLRNPVNDVRAMARTLRELGFTVLAHENTNKRAMETAILEFGRRLADGGVGFFYYAGHGLQVRGRNYLVPVDAEIDSEAATRIAAVDVDLLLEQMAEARNRVNVVILDACRNNPFERRLRGASKGLAAVDAARGTLIAYATAPGSVAADGEGANGLYTEELLKALRVPGLKVEEVFKQVRVGVTSRSKGAQTPWESSSLTGDLVVNTTVNVTSPAAPPPPSSGAPFDGLWAVTIDCPRTSAGSSGAEGYVIHLLAKVKDGALHGQRGSEGQPNSFTLVGKIQPDGHAALSARGMTGDPKHSVNREAPGVAYGWRATALFEGSRGIGKKTEVRPCDLSFVKK